MSAVEMPSELERVRMAVAEAGYDPEAILMVFGSPSFDRLAIPQPVAWRAREVASFGVPMCVACHVIHSDRLTPPARNACTATRRFEQDCGVSR